MQPFCNYLLLKTKNSGILTGIICVFSIFYPKEWLQSVTFRNKFVIVNELLIILIRLIAFQLLDTLLQQSHLLHRLAQLTIRMRNMQRGKKQLHEQHEDN